MNEIVCATRGGEGSRAVQMAAIAQAKVTKKPLVFIYVASMRNFSQESPSLREAIREEIIWLGRALLFVAKTRAENAGISATTAIREGDVEDEICDFLKEHEASLLLLGAPRGTTSKLIGDDPIERFAARLHECTQVEIQVIRPEDEEVTWFDHQANLL